MIVKYIRANKYLKKLFIKSCGITLYEIMLALLILASTLIPIFGLLTQDLKGTDLFVAQNFAIDRARLVLNTILEDVKFSDLLPGNPAILIGQSATKWANILFPNAAAVGNGFVCNAVVSDTRGIYYRIYLRSDPIVDTTPNDDTGDELYFSFYENPTPEKQNGWATIVSRAENAERRENRPSIYSKSGSDNPHQVVNHYRFINFADASAKLWGPAEEAKRGAPYRLGQSKLVRPRSDGRIYLMQRLVLQISWNQDMAYFSNPDATQGKPQRFHVITFKADLD